MIVAGRGEAEGAGLSNTEPSGVVKRAHRAAPRGLEKHWAAVGAAQPRPSLPRPPSGG